MSKEKKVNEKILFPSSPELLQKKPLFKPIRKTKFPELNKSQEDDYESQIYNDISDCLCLKELNNLLNNSNKGHIKKENFPVLSLIKNEREFNRITNSYESVYLNQKDTNNNDDRIRNELTIYENNNKYNFSSGEIEGKLLNKIFIVNYYPSFKYSRKNQKGNSKSKNVSEKSVKKITNKEKEINENFVSNQIISENSDKKNKIFSINKIFFNPKKYSRINTQNFQIHLYRIMNRTYNNKSLEKNLIKKSQINNANSGSNMIISSIQLNNYNNSKSNYFGSKSNNSFHSFRNNNNKYDNHQFREINCSSASPNKRNKNFIHSPNKAINYRKNYYGCIKNKNFVKGQNNINISSLNKNKSISLIPSKNLIKNKYWNYSNNRKDKNIYKSNN